jgi:hypothetical protein
MSLELMLVEKQDYLLIALVPINNGISENQYLMQLALHKAKRSYTGVKKEEFVAKNLKYIDCNMVDFKKEVQYQRFLQ